MKTHTPVIVFLALLAVFPVVRNARAQTVVINTFERGWYNSNGFQGAVSSNNISNDNYFAGNAVGEILGRNFFAFNIGSLAYDEVYSAGVFSARSANSVAPQGISTYQIWDYNGSISTLVGGTGGVTAYSNLGGGTSFGSMTFSTSGVYTSAVTLNSAGLAAITSAQGAQFAFGGSVPSASIGAVNDFVFGMTGSGNPNDGNTYITLTKTTVAAGGALYWDLDGTTGGSGDASPSGTWAATARNWNQASSGIGPTLGWLDGSSAIFSSATGSYTVTLGGDVSVDSITYQDGGAGSQLTLAAGAGQKIVMADTQMEVAVAAETTLQSAAEIAGAGLLSKSGAGTLMLTTNNTYTGATTIGAGKLALSGAGALSTSTAINLSASGAVFDIAGITATGSTNGSLAGVAGSFVNLGSKNFNVGGDNSSTTFAGVISNTGSLTKSGAGTTTLSGANTYSGATTISNGALRAANATALGSTAAGTTLASGAALELSGGVTVGAEALTLSGSGIANGGALRNVSGDNTYQGTITLATNSTISSDAGSTLRVGNIDIGATTRVLSFSNEGTTVLTGNLSGMNTSSIFRKEGGGSLVISNTTANTAGGQLALAAGSVTLAAGTYSTNSGTAPRALDLGIGAAGVSTNSAAFYVNAGQTMSNSIYVAPAGAGGAGTRTLGTESTSGTATFNREIYLGGDLVVSAAAGGTAHFSGNLVNSGNLTKAGAGTVILSGINTATGDVTLNAGTLAVTNGSAVNDSALVTVGSGATLSVLGSETISGLAGAGEVSIAASKSLTDSVSGASQTFSGTLSGSGSLVKAGSGTQVLTGNSTGFSGETVLNNGTILAGNDGAFGTGTVTINYNDGTGTRALASADASTRTLDNNFNLYYRDLTIGQTNGGTGSLTLGGSGKTFFIGNDGGSTTRFITVHGNHTIAADVSGGANNNIDKVGSGTLVLSGANNFGALFIDEGAIDLGAGSLSAGSIDLGGGLNGIPINAADAKLRVSTNGTFGRTIYVNGELNGSGVAGARTIEFGNTGGAAALSGNVIVEKNFTAHVANSGATGIFAGVLSGTGGKEITVSGNGILGLTGASSTTDARWKIESGATLAIGDTRNLGENPGGYYASKVILNGGTLGATNSFSLNANIGVRLAADSSISVGSGLVMTNPAAMWGSGMLMKTGAGTLVLSGANTFSGGTEVVDGVLVVSGNSITGAISNDSILTFNESAAGTYASTVSGIGSLVKTGSGTLTLSGSNSFTGATVISAGTVILTNGSAIMDSAAVTNSGAALQVNSSETIGSLRGNGVVDLSGGGVVLTVGEAGSNTYSGAINGAGGLAKTGEGTMTLSGVNSYLGATAVSAGTMVVDGSANNSTFTVNNGGALGGSGSVGGIVLNVGATINPGNSPGTFNVLSNAVWNPGGNYNWQVFNASGIKGGTNGYDWMNVSGSLDLSALSVGNEFNINLWSLSGIAPDTNGSALFFTNTSNYTWTILTASNGIVGFSADKFTINTGVFNGTGGFANALGGGVFSLLQDGNDLNLRFTAAGGEVVPEPGTWAAAALLAGGAAFVRWRRRKEMISRP